MVPRRTREVEIPETDRLEGFAHPRGNSALVGHAEALARVSRGVRSGRPPQAWLLVGPPGVGKATLAYRIARYLLKYGATDGGSEDLGVPEQDRVAMRVAAGTHPGLLVIKRGLNDSGRLMTETSVNEVRKLGNFFGLTSGAGGWRIAIVDTADDLNDNSANALLKLLEEPPDRAMLLLLANTPGRLLPTIRSRCQRLDLKPLELDLVAREIAKLLPDAKPADREALARLSGGSIGLALQLAGGDGVLLAREADKLTLTVGAPDIPALLALSDKILRITDGIDTLGTFLVENLRARIVARAENGAPHLDLWLEALSKLRHSFARTSGLHLHPQQTLISAARTIARAAKRAGTLD